MSLKFPNRDRLQEVVDSRGAVIYQKVLEEEAERLLELVTTLRTVVRW